MAARKKSARKRTARKKSSVKKTARKKKGKRGGARPGAGRKPLPPGERQSEQVLVTFRPSEFRDLVRAAKGPLATYVRSAVLKDLARRSRGRR